MVLHDELERAFTIAKAMGGDYCLNIQRGEPVMVNDKRVSKLVHQVALDLLGDGHILPMEPEMGGEDFSILAGEAPGAMFTLGTRKRGEVRLLHSPHFDIDENALPIGVAILTESVIRYLTSGIERPSKYPSI